MGMTSEARRVLRIPAAWEEKRPRTEKVVMAASFRSEGPRRKREWRRETMLGLVPRFLPSLSDPMAGWMGSGHSLMDWENRYGVWPGKDCGDPGRGWSCLKSSMQEAVAGPV